jgi:hypothetical protein
MEGHMAGSFLHYQLGFDHYLVMRQLSFSLVELVEREISPNQWDCAVRRVFQRLLGWKNLIGDMLVESATGRVRLPRGTVLHC